MVTEHSTYTLETPVLPLAASTELASMIDRVKPGVVQVRCGQRGAGAGIVWRADGGILTNDHVIAAGERFGGRASIQVHLADGRTFDARVVNRNQSLDLAMLEIPASDLPALPVGDSTRLRVGELVLAIGHPWGQRDIVTAGIISGLGSVPVQGSRQSVRYIRSDVRLAPGNSGGPLLDAHGTVMGINAMIFGGDLSVAIPSHIATEWVAGPPGRPVFLGVQVQPVRLGDVPALRNRAAYAAGMLIVGIEAGGPADRAAMLVGDVVLDVEGQPVPDAETLLGSLAERSAQGQMRLQVLRGGTIQTVQVDMARSEQQV